VPSPATGVGEKGSGPRHCSLRYLIAPLAALAPRGSRLVAAYFVGLDVLGASPDAEIAARARVLARIRLPLRESGGEHSHVTKPQHRADRFIDAESDPREGGVSLGDERSTLTDYLRTQRLTLRLKCEGLDAAQLARRAVEPSTMSLLGLVRHLAEVERRWFRQRFAGQDVPNRYQSEDDPDGDFNGAVADQAIVNEAWTAWQDEVSFAEQFVGDTDLNFVGRDGAGEPISLRELLVHMIEEYARHNGHADLLRERIDGRIGQ
jgi:uncharacterized damage-inducible protein DinB